MLGLFTKKHTNRACTLCVIDVQDYFSAARKRLPQIVKEIELAKRRNAGIIVLEYDGCGPSSKEVRDALEGYKHVRFVTKPSNDGSAEFVKEALKKDYCLGRVRFCGVNRSACVHDTIRGFQANKKTKSSRVEIAIDATWCTSPEGGRSMLRGLGKFVKTHV